MFREGSFIVLMALAGAGLLAAVGGTVWLLWFVVSNLAWVG